jgi:hypothetical protein
MGLNFLELEIANPANPAVTERIDFLIDSGAIYSVVPGGILERIGIQPLAVQEFRLANGTKVQRKKGVVYSNTGIGSGVPMSSSVKKATAYCSAPLLSKLWASRSIPCGGS